MQAKLDDTLEVTREIVRAFFQGNLDPWFARLCAGSMWVGPGEQTISGGEAIREYFSRETQKRTLRVFREKYDALPVNARCSAVVAHIEAGKPNAASAQMTATYSILYQLVGGETKAVLTHASHGLLRSFKPNRDSPLTWVPAYHLYRNLLLDLPETGRIAVPSGGKTFYIHPNVILYVQSRNRRAELFCVDTLIRSDLSISRINALLPQGFCAIHRCYTVNSRYVSAIQRYKVTLVTGEALPIPAEAYNQIKARLDRLISAPPDQPEG